MATDANAGKNPEIEQWDKRFANDFYWFGTDPNPFVAAEAKRLKPGQKVLTIADGEGRNGVYLARQGLAVTSVDFAPLGVEKSKKLAAENKVGLDFICADLATWDWGKPRFEAVVGILFQFAAPKFRSEIFRHMRDVLLPGGFVMIQGYRPEQLAYGTGGPPFVDNLYTEDMFRAEFADMEILHLKSYDREQPEGMRAKGLCALIDFVARKR